LLHYINYSCQQAFPALQTTLQPSFLRPRAICDIHPVFSYTPQFSSLQLGYVSDLGCPSNSWNPGDLVLDAVTTDPGFYPSVSPSYVTFANTHSLSVVRFTELNYAARSPLSQLLNCCTLLDEDISPPAYAVSDRILPKT
jgi:hypothetical protein